LNGISSNSLPFKTGLFDVVCASHVLEHIPDTEKTQFLDDLCAKSRKAVVLLNPFFAEDGAVEERLRLFIEITDAKWAKEHLECGMPRIEFVTEYADTRGLDCGVESKGVLTTGIAMIFVNYFANKAGMPSELEKINRFFNTHYISQMDESDGGGQYLVTLTKR
jgi:hypothetical protein